MGAAAADGPVRGNRIWIAGEAGRPVLQKHYGARAGLLGSVARSLGTSLRRRKTGISPRARRRTEALLLELWRSRGLDVPRDLSAEHPGLSGERTLVLEFFRGAPLGNILRETRFDRTARSDLLRRFAASWGARHAIALSSGDARFVQEHGTFDHVLTDGVRFVTIDLEQGFLAGGPVMPLLAKEVAGYLRTLWQRTDEATFAGDLAALIAGYPDRAVLARAAEEYLASPSPFRRLLWRLDRALRRRRRSGDAKYAPLRALRAALSSTEIGARSGRND